MSKTPHEYYLQVIGKKFDEEIGEVLPITADKDNPVSDGKEFAGGEEDE